MGSHIIWKCETFHPTRRVVNTVLNFQNLISFMFIFYNYCVNFTGELFKDALSSQWFGNLVTTRWWNDLWLNEGFATYVSYLGADKVEPTWNMVSLAEPRIVADDCASYYVVPVQLYHDEVCNTPSGPVCKLTSPMCVEYTLIASSGTRRGQFIYHFYYY